MINKKAGILISSFLSLNLNQKKGREKKREIERIFLPLVDVDRSIGQKRQGMN
jgi:hypothetical protein